MAERPPAGDAGGRPSASLRGQLLRWLLLPLSALVVIGALSTYRYAREATNLAYDRTLLASSRAIAERVQVLDGRVAVDVPWVALDIFETDIPGRIYYKVTGINGEFISGYDDFPPLPARVPRSESYPALVRFYDGTYRAEPLRVAALYHPVYEGGLRGMVLIQVGETLDARRALTRTILLEALGPQIALIVSVAVLTWFAVRFALRPLMRLANAVERRSPTDLAGFDLNLVHREVRPLVTAMNHSMERLRTLIDGQRRFITDASHQLRTPLAVLKTQAQIGLRQDSPPGVREVLAAFHATLDRATRLVNQLLSRARAEQGIATRSFVEVDLVDAVKQVCLEMAEVAGRKHIDLSFESSPEAFVEGDPLLLHELAANLVDNAVQYAPEHGRVSVRVARGNGAPWFKVEDSGPGIPPAERDKVFEPFYRITGSGNPASQPGSGLGLAIAREIAAAHGATIRLEDALSGGLRVMVEFGRGDARAQAS